jgi:hypothetical protein
MVLRESVLRDCEHHGERAGRKYADKLPHQRRHFFFSP